MAHVAPLPPRGTGVACTFIEVPTLSGLFFYPFVSNFQNSCKSENIFGGTEASWRHFCHDLVFLVRPLPDEQGTNRSLV